MKVTGTQGRLKEKHGHYLLMGGRVRGAGGSRSWCGKIAARVREHSDAHPDHQEVPAVRELGRGLLERYLR
ncbi:MAG TPA: hypothetical protein VJ350_03750 [Methanoregula sp.]|nr:hypothetical protein [Methanoregula sp.]